MLRETTVTANTVEEAKKKACEELGTEPENTQFEILQQPEKKMFGLFGGSNNNNKGGKSGGRGNPANLIPLNRRTSIEQRKIATMGGKASGAGIALAAGNHLEDSTGILVGIRRRNR